MEITKKKLSDSKQAGAQYLCTACPYCHLQFETAITNIPKNNGNLAVPSVLYTELLGLCMGIDKDHLGSYMNQVDVGTLEVYQS